MKKAGEISSGGMAAILALDVTTGQELCQKANQRNQVFLYNWPMIIVRANCSFGT